MSKKHYLLHYLSVSFVLCFISFNSVVFAYTLDLWSGETLRPPLKSSMSTIETGKKQAVVELVRELHEKLHGYILWAQLYPESMGDHGIPKDNDESMLRWRITRQKQIIQDYPDRRIEEDCVVIRFGSHDMSLNGVHIVLSWGNIRISGNLSRRAPDQVGVELLIPRSLWKKGNGNALRIVNIQVPNVGEKSTIMPTLSIELTNYLQQRGINIGL